MNNYSKRVYSTATGSRCPHCGKQLKSCHCPAAPVVNDEEVKKQTKVRVSRESKGRKGSGVTLITGLNLADGELKTLAKQFKQLCGSGGAVKQGVIEIQGEHRDKLVAELNRLGYSAVKAGG